MSDRDRRELRPAGPSDYARLAELERLCFADPWDEATLRLYLTSGAVLGFLTTEEPPTGYALFQLLPGETEILRIGIAPGERGRGRGRRLLAACLEELSANGHSAVHLEVRAGNAPARRLYERLGFELTGHRRAYYADGEDALRYSFRGAPLGG